MSVRLRILAMSCGFMIIICTLGALAQRQVTQMGRLAIDIYDHAFMGVSYVDQTQVAFLRLAGAHAAGQPVTAGEVQVVLDQLGVALERAASGRTRTAGEPIVAALRGLPQVPAAELSKRLNETGQALTRLVKRYAADGLDARDAAEELANAGRRTVLIQIGIAVACALGLGWGVGRSLSRPLVQLVRVMKGLAAGELELQMAPRLTRRHDEIGELGRAADVFRQAMQQNARAGEERRAIEVRAALEKRETMRAAADKIESETRTVTKQSMLTSSSLASHAEELSVSATRVLDSVGMATEASGTALARSQMVAAAGEQLSASAREIGNQISGTAAELADAGRAGERARQIIDELAQAVAQIGNVAGEIGGIAGRTNLLALNATIEAAQAGVAGAGFAVVAGEVKALAGQTARSSAEIRRSAAAVQAATRDAVSVVGEMVQRVASIERIAQAVAAAAEQQVAATGEIARSVAATADAVREVTQQIAIVTQEARATDGSAGEMRSLASEVSNRIDELRDVMVRVVRTSSDEADRREGARVAMNEPVRLATERGEVAATCLDLSATGARFSVVEPVPKGRVVLHMPGLPALPGMLVRDGDDTAMQFDWEAAAAPPELLARLRMAAAA